MQPPEPEFFSWLTTEKAVALIAVIAAAVAYYFGGRKREKLDTQPGVVSMVRTNELLEEILSVLRGISRQSADRAEVDHAVHVQIRDEIRLLRSTERVHGDTVKPPRQRRRRPSSDE